jgi:hypothetical protein
MFLLPMLASAAISAIGNNITNKENEANQQAAETSGEQYAQQQQAAAEKYQQQALANAITNMQQYQQVNPSVATQIGAIQGPPQLGVGQTIGGGVIGPSGTPGQVGGQAPAQMGGQLQPGQAAPQPQINPQMMQQLMALFQRQQQSPPPNVPQPGVQVAQWQPAQDPARSQQVQNLAQTLLRSGQGQQRRSFGPTMTSTSGGNI